jgi:hypothetical protein
MLNIPVPDSNLKSFSRLDSELEVLGRRLDHARRSLKLATRSWSRDYWQRAVDRLVLQWQNLPHLYDAKAQFTSTPRWKIDYNFFERHEGTVKGDLADVVVNTFRKPDLTGSWERERDRQVSRAKSML